MLILIDWESFPGSWKLTYLLTFERVSGFTVENRFSFVEQEGGNSYAEIGEGGKRFVAIPPPDQTTRIAEKISSDRASSIDRQEIERALNLVKIAAILHADLLVPPVAGRIPPQYAGFFTKARLVSVSEALSVVGAHVRQRDPVPLAGNPALQQARAEVYAMTGRSLVPGGAGLWKLASRRENGREDLQDYVEAAIGRIGQAIRGRDGVHEALRIATGRHGVEDALYHFDVVLTSGVAALDAIARFTHLYFGLNSPKNLAGWNRPAWLKELRRAQKDVADIVRNGSRIGAALRIIHYIRNTIHGVPVREFLNVEPGRFDSPVEHRVALSAELVELVSEAGGPLGPLSDHGLFLDENPMPVMNVGVLTEDILVWLLEIVDALIAAILRFESLESESQPELGGLALLERKYVAALAGVGDYPVDRSRKGLAATPSLTQRIMSMRASALRRIRGEQL